MVTLKKDMRVVLQHNLDPDYGLVNGAQGTVIGFEEFNSEKLPRKSRNDESNTGGAPDLGGAHPKYAQAQIKLFAEWNGNPSWPVVLFDNGQVATIFPDCAINEFGDEEPFSLLSRTQIPLMAGYAVTIHKAQVRISYSRRSFRMLTCVRRV
jgi:ATP-dependent DNA helicase PIF1